MYSKPSTPKKTSMAKTVGKNFRNAVDVLTQSRKIEIRIAGQKVQPTPEVKVASDKSRGWPSTLRLKNSASYRKIAMCVKS